MSSTATTAADSASFQELLEPHRPELYAHSYRMLGSVDERELGGVFGIAVAVAVFAGFASPRAFSDGFEPAIWVTAGLALLGAVRGLALPSRRTRQTIAPLPSIAQPAVELEQAA